MGKTTTLQVQRACLYISLASLHDYDLKKKAQFHVLRRTWTSNDESFFLFLNLDIIEGIRLQNNSLAFEKVQKYHNTLCRPSKILHKHCLQFLLGLTIGPREIENNAYAKFWRDNKEYYGIFYCIDCFGTEIFMSKIKSIKLLLVFLKKGLCRPQV